MRGSDACEPSPHAVIAEPYTRETWQFLTNWGQRATVPLAHPKLDLPAASDPSDVWSNYTATKARWTSDEKTFKEAYPLEPRYRHSLREEVSALMSVVDNVEARLKEGQLKEQALSVGTQNLVALRKAGVIEAYVLLAMADEGISRDYLEYRKQNRDKLRQYLTDFVTAGK